MRRGHRILVGVVCSLWTATAGAQGLTPLPVQERSVFFETRRQTRPDAVLLPVNTHQNGMGVSVRTSISARLRPLASGARWSVSDYLQLGASLVGGEEEEDAPAVYVPFEAALQFGRLIGDHLQVVGRVGVLGGVGVDASVSPFVLARVRASRIAVEGGTAFPGGDLPVEGLNFGVVRWYPQGPIAGLNVGLRYEEERGIRPLAPAGRPMERVLQLFVSVEK